MQESDTYLMILDEGQEKCARELILRIGARRLGPPDESVKGYLESITDPEHLKRIACQTPDAASWQELLATT